MHTVRRAAVLVFLVATACGPSRAFVAHGREGSWRRVARGTFDAGTSHSVNGVAAAGDGYGRWTAVGSVRDGATGRTTAAAWSADDAMRWGRSELDARGVRASTASAVAVGQGAAVVVGTVITPAGDRDARVWVSRDGAIWTAVPVAGGAGDQSMTSVGAGPLGFVAAGVDRARPAVWTSADGAVWNRVESPAFLENEQIRGVAVGRAGAVAVGTIDAGGDLDGMVWFSADGASWRTVPLGAAGFTGRADQRVNAVAATAGGFVAVGDDADGDRRAAVAWTSPDGMTWGRQPPSGDLGPGPVPGASPGLSAGAVAGSGPVVAAGGSGYEVYVWSSPDGRRWTSEDVLGDVGGADGPRVATAGGAILVAGTARLAFRPPGGRWVDVGSDADVFPAPAQTPKLTEMTRTAHGFVAVDTSGVDTVWRSSDGATWRRGANPSGSVDGLTALGETAVAVGTAGGIAAVWTSGDGGDTWDRADEGNPAFSTGPTTQIFGVTAGGPGVVAVGLGWDGRTIDARAWASPDGRTWRRAVEPPEWNGLGDEVLSVVCPLPGGGVVALGNVVMRGDQDAWAWVSQDGMTWTRATGPGAAVLGGPGHQGVTGCARTAGGVLVTARVRGRGGDDGAVWATADGMTWTSVGGADTFSGPGDDGLRSIAADGNRIVITGIEHGTVSVYTSGDAGATWRKRTVPAVGGFDDDQASAVAIVDDHVVFTGSDGPSGAVWIGPAP